MDKKKIQVIILFALITVTSIGLVITKNKSLDNEPEANNQDVIEEQPFEENDKEEESPSTDNNNQPSNNNSNDGNQSSNNDSNNNNQSSDNDVNDDDKSVNSNNNSGSISTGEIDGDYKDEESNSNDFNTPSNGAKTITVKNRCQNTAQALEKIYQDNNYEYYLTSISSGCIYVTVNGQEYTLKSAINDNIVTVYELEANGFKFMKKERNIETM